MAVAFDAVGTVAVASGAITTIDLTTLTVGSGPNRALVAKLCFTGGVSGLTVVWDQGGTNQSCTQITNATLGGAQVFLFGLVNPISGNKTLRASWSGFSDVYLQALSVIGANQSGGASSFPNGAGATGTGITPSITVTSRSGDMVVAAHCSASAGTMTAVNQTQTFLNNTATQIRGGGNRADGVAAVSMTASVSLSAQWASVGSSIRSADPLVGGFFASTMWDGVAPVIVQPVIAVPYR